jgi:hypothetical protein
MVLLQCKSEFDWRTGSPVGLGFSGRIRSGVPGDRNSAGFCGKYVEGINCLRG